jgi:hypothetical protein
MPTVFVEAAKLITVLLKAASYTGFWESYIIHVPSILNAPPRNTGRQGSIAAVVVHERDDLLAAIVPITV